MSDRTRTTSDNATEHTPKSRIWAFSVDWHMPPPEPPDPDAPPTEADLAFDRLVEKARGFARKTGLRRGPTSASLERKRLSDA